MKNYWKLVKIGDIGEVVGGGTPSTKCSDYYGGDIPWITPKDLSNFRNRYISRGERMISKLGLENSSARMLPPFSVLFTSRAPIGYIAIAKNELCTNQGFKSIIPDPKKCNALFLYYLLKYKKNDIELIANGSTFQEVSGTALKNFEVSIPPLDEQRKIAGVLSALDDKIELNNKINRNLEAQAQAIFKSWFIDFEPFGGSMPKRWKIGNLLDIATYLNGLSMQKYKPRKGYHFLPVLKIRELRQGFCDKDSNICSTEIGNEFIIDDGDIVFSWSGTLLINIWCAGKCGLNQHLFKVFSKKYDKWFYYLWTKHYLPKFIHIASGKATTMGHIKREDLEKAKVLIPSKEEYLYLSRIMSPIINRMIQNRLESVNIAKLRDMLLPKLMSGEILIS